MKINKLAIIASYFTSVICSTGSGIELDNFKLSITDSTGESKLTEKLTYPKALSSPLQLETSDVIRLSYKLVKTEDKLPVDLSYNTIVIESETKEYSYHQVQTSGKVGQFKLNLPYKSLSKNIKAQGGSDTNFNIYLLVRGNNQKDTIKYKLASLSLPESKKKLDTEKKSEFGPLPLIHHTFRPDEKVPLKALSLVFSGLVLAPWALLLVGWTSNSVNFSKFPTNPTKAVYNAGFIGTLVAYTVLNYLYWTKLNVFETIYYFTIITLFSVPFGYLTLKNHN
ncbi:hypothetical protein CONCODRAFT_80951 [Conidiobolus coronatus NRRL 28638]|uniref:Ribophorin II n=1 Tax=Conidiobolus coronatus (strain ATCC 28846 / CBS 209.66 / NRRL 28638) TaxID=796925 RepID=A0A137NP22_CONC2|nr:hypothetical protein CONCODRAFT_80951 [Conidiobolus coronatus NRRL 28638]|eukprot:KXN64544.1 hypothetical protein CONCODRAFT_80951 [Conidiobolus coronatus NRRL 28638]